MTNCVLQIGSVTHAMRAQKLLSEMSVPSKVVKTKNDGRGRGCMYGVQTDLMYKNTAMRILADADISYTIASDK